MRNAPGSLSLQRSRETSPCHLQASHQFLSEITKSRAGHHLRRPRIEEQEEREERRTSRMWYCLMSSLVLTVSRALVTIVSPVISGRKKERPARLREVTHKLRQSQTYGLEFEFTSWCFTFQGGFRVGWVTNALCALRRNCSNFNVLCRSQILRVCSLPLLLFSLD